MGNYNVRKISDLTPALQVNSGDLFCLSQLDTESRGYSSKSVDFATVNDSIVSAAVDSARKAFDIPDGLSVSSGLFDKIKALESGEFAISAATFAETPLLAKPQPPMSQLDGRALVTKDTAESIVDADKSYLSDKSAISCDPGNAGGYTAIAPPPAMLQWHFNHGGRDSSEWVPQAGGRAAGYVECPATGLLTMYGWLADNGGVLPEECWVAVFGRVRCLVDAESGTYEERDVALAVQPWPIGANSQVAQYVGFQLPVRKGLKLKVMTGFNVNGRNSGFGMAHSLMANDPSTGGNMPNTFIGYIFESGGGE